MTTKVQIIFEIANVSPIIFSQKHRPDEKKRKPLTSVSLFSSLGNWHPYPGAPMTTAFSCSPMRVKVRGAGIDACCVILTFTIYLEKPVSSLKHLLMRAAWKS